MKKSTFDKLNYFDPSIIVEIRPETDILLEYREALKKEEEKFYKKFYEKFHQKFLNKNILEEC